MTALQLLDASIVAAVVVVAVVAVVVPRRAAATTAFLVFGILLAVLWGRIDAPDIALAEAALGGGVAGALLVDALGRSRPPHLGRPRVAASVATTAVAVLAGGASLAALLTVLRELPAEPAPLAGLAAAELEGTGVAHPVTAVLLSYRNLDTLLEIAVLVIAAYGAGALTARAQRARPASDPVRRALAVVLLPVVLLVAVWLLVAGTTQPGGAFQSGALLGAALVIARLCGIPFTTPRGAVGTVLLTVGLLAFVLLAAIGLVAAGQWLALDPPWAGGAILAIEAVLAVTIGVALAMIFGSAGAAETEATNGMREGTA